MPGRLLLIPTPIGNLGDMTERAIAELRVADLVFAEDTRRTGLLLQHFGIEAKLRSMFVGNERSRTQEALKHLREGLRIAVVSDAGTPGVSDPGADLVAAAIAEGHAVEVLPGAQAILPALLLSGLPPVPFSFIGFLPRRRSERVRSLTAVSGLPWTLVFYEAPHRLAAMLQDALEVLGDRRAALTREITKLHEETRRGALGQILVSVEQDPPRGEIVVVIAGAEEREPEEAVDLTSFIRQGLGTGLGPREIADLARARGFSRRTAYQAALSLANSDDDRS